MNYRPKLWGSLPRYTLVLALLAGGLVGRQEARAVAVDAEVLFLVDVSKSVSNGEYDTMMESLAQSFESGAVLDSLQSGGLGSIAATLVFYGDKNLQSVGVGWIEMSSALDAEAFATALRNAPRPGNPKKTALANALDFATPTFGGETGGALNGFESDVQSIMFVGGNEDNGSSKTGGSRETTVQLARDNALASGVDIINALTVGSLGSVDDYFTQNVIGGAIGANLAKVTNVANFSELPAGLTPAVLDHIVTSVPEPSWWTSLALVTMVSLGRRRRV